MKKIWLILVSCILWACSFHSSQSYTFNVETGDAIKVELNTTDGHTLKQDNGQFSVEKDEKELVHGLFLTMDMYHNLYQATQGPFVKILDSKEDGLIQYYLYEVMGQRGMERNYLISLGNTGIALASLEDEATVRECFELLTFTLEK